MPLKYLLLAFMLLGSAYAQLQPAAPVIPKIETVTVRPGAAVILHLSFGYVSAVRLHEAVSSIALGDPSAFKAEHSEAESHLIFFKPLSGEPASSNALIVTSSGKTIALSLVSERRSGTAAEIDYLVNLRSSGAMVADARGTTEDAASAPPEVDEAVRRSPLGKLLDQEIRLEAGVPIPPSNTGLLDAVVGRSLQMKSQSLVAFSVRNRSDRPLELLSPQVDLVLRRPGGNHHLASDPIPISEYRSSRRRLEPGERADGVVVFERPSSKPADALLQLRLASANEADQPIALTIPFIPQIPGEAP